MTTALELLRYARQCRPTVRYAMSRKENAIGGFVADVGRFVMVASLGIDGQWYSVPYEILVNGEPPFKPADWIEDVA